MNSGEILAVLQRLRELGYKHFRFEQSDIVLEVDVDSSGHVAQGRSRGQGAAPPAQAHSASPAPSQAPADSGLVAIRAPMSGTFYRAPAPTEPPFVEVGSKVGASDTVCIVEVMKLFNTIAAGVAGTVVEIVAGNEQAVTTGMPMIWIRPS